MKLSMGSLLLALVGLIALIVGGAILIDPIGFHATAGIVVRDDPALLNEMRAAGGGVLAVGLLAALGLTVRRFRFAAIAASAFVYLGYGLARTGAVLVDGMPNGMVVWIAALEILMGLACAAVLVRDQGLRNG